MIDPTIRVGDVVIDCAQNATCYVVELAADTVVEFNAHSSMDVLIEEYGCNPLFEPSLDEPVWSVVYLTGDVKSAPGSTYDFPASRLARYAVEEANQDLRRVQDALVVDLLERLFATTVPCTTPSDRTEVADLAIRAGIPTDLVDEAVERSEVDAVIGGDD